MDTWTIQKGYPVLTINRLDNTRLNLKQHWFLLNPIKNFQNADEFNNMRWYIPFTFTTKEILSFDSEMKPVWFRSEDSECMCEINNNDRF